MDWLDTALGAALLAAVLGGAGFLIKRSLTSAPARERTSLYNEVTDLMLKMRAAGVSLEDVQNFEVGLRSKVRAAEGRPSAGSETGQYWTQAEMNRRAYASREVAEAELAAVMAELAGFLSDEQRSLMDRAHELWLEYRAAEAELAASDYEGGSMQPLVRATELASLAQDRLSRLRAAVEERRAR